MFTVVITSEVFKTGDSQSCVAGNDFDYYFKFQSLIL